MCYPPSPGTFIVRIDAEIFCADGHTSNWQNVFRWTVDPKVDILDLVKYLEGAVRYYDNCYMRSCQTLPTILNLDTFTDHEEGLDKS